MMKTNKPVSKSINGLGQRSSTHFVFLTSERTSRITETLERTLNFSKKMIHVIWKVFSWNKKLFFKIFHCMKSRMFEAVYVDVMYNDYCERELTKNIYIFPILTATWNICNSKDRPQQWMLFYLMYLFILFNNRF